MYTLPRSNYIRRSPLVHSDMPDPTTAISRPGDKGASRDSDTRHSQRVKQELRALGVGRAGLWRSESRYLPRAIHADELLGGVVYGHNDDGRVMLVATDCRVIFLDKKPLFINEDEVTYDVVSGVSYSHAGPGATVTLHTRIKDYTVHTLNQKSAKKFVHYIESHVLEHKTDELRQQ